MKNMVLCAVLAFAVRTSGQPPLPVVIESWRYDPRVGD